MTKKYVPVMGRRQRIILALIAEGGGTVLVRDLQSLGVDWAAHRDRVNAVAGLVKRGCLESREKDLTADSRVYITDKGRDALKAAEFSLSKLECAYGALFDAPSHAMMADVEVALKRGDRVCIVVGSMKRRNEVLRAVRYKFRKYRVVVATPSECGLDWLAMKVRNGYEYTTFIEPSLVEEQFAPQIEYLRKYKEYR